MKNVMIALVLMSIVGCGQRPECTNPTLTAFNLASHLTTSNTEADVDAALGMPAQRYTSDNWDYQLQYNLTGTDGKACNPMVVAIKNGYFCAAYSLIAPVNCTTK